MMSKTSLKLLILFLALFYVLSYAAAIPATRYLNSARNNFPVQEFKVHQGGDLVTVDDNCLEGRMDIEMNDYPGAGANNHHDPGTPGRE